MESSDGVRGSMEREERREESGQRHKECGERHKESGERHESKGEECEDERSGLSMSKIAQLGPRTIQSSTPKRSLC